MFQKINKGLALRNSKGFTLIELLVVIAIIGLLASIVVVALQGPRQQARDTKREGDIRNIQTALELCYGDSTCGGLEAYKTFLTYAAAKTGGLAPYISADNMPDDPQSGGLYVWVDNTGADQTYCVFATLEAGETGAERVYASQLGFGHMALASSVCP